MIIGHQKQWQFLKKSAELNKLSHAYLFYGQEKLGKKTLALEFIKFLECEKGIGKSPCQKCSSCLQIQKKFHPDLTIIEPQKNEIQIAQIRELNWKLSLRAYSAPVKTAIIDQAHSMNQESQSCLLKTLEEPKGRSLLILITEYPESLFPTILSRVQKIKFYPVKKSEIIGYLQRNGVKDEEAEEIARVSLGRPGQAAELMLDRKRLEFRKKAISDFIKISGFDLAPRFQYAENLSAEPQNLKETLEIWLSFLRKNLISSLSNQKERRYSISPIGSYSPGKLKKIIQNVQSTNFLISTTNVSPRLALEILMMEM